MFNFKKFEGRNIKAEGRITVTKSYSIGFPKKFYDDNLIDRYKYVVLFYDAENKAIAIQFMNDEDRRNEKNRFSIADHEGYGGSVIVRSFFKALGIDPTVYHGRYEWKKQNIEGEGEVYVIELKERDGEQLAGGDG